MDNVNIDFFSFDTELNTEVEIITNKIENPQKKDKLKIKIKSDNIPIVFTKVRDLYNYIKLNCVTHNDYYIFEIINNNIKISIIMRSHKQILNYVLTYYVNYELIE